jgi:hypothetical protein
MAEQNATGLEDIRHLLDRFPEDERTVRSCVAWIGRLVGAEGGVE